MLTQIRIAYRVTNYVVYFIYTYMLLYVYRNEYKWLYCFMLIQSKWTFICPIS